MRLRSIAFTALACVSLQACSESEKPPFPKALIDQFDEDTRENIAEVDYQIYKEGAVRAFIITLPVGYCGSAGCQTVIFVEKAGTFRKIYSDAARSVTPIPVYPEGLDFKIQRSGAVCGKKSNAEECYLNVRWTGRME